MDATFSDSRAHANAAAAVTTGRVSTVIDAGNVQALRLYWSLFALGVVLVCAPLWTTQYPPLLDYPNHLARAFVIYHYEDNAFYRSAYDRLREPVPNLAIDLVVPPLLRFFEVKTAGKIFLTLMLALFALGCHLLGRALHGRPTWLALIFTILVFNQTVFWGFVNYFFGVGMFLVTVSLWLRWRKEWTWWRLGFVAVLVFLSYTAHLSAYACLGVALAVITGFDWLKAKRITGSSLLGLTPLVPPLVTFVAFMRGTGEKGQLVWGEVTGKILNLAAWPVGYHYWLDGALLAVVLGVGGWLLWRSKNLRIVGPPFAVGLLFWALYLICPLAIFTSYSADIRFVAPAILFTLLPVRFELNKRLGQWALAVCLLVAVARVGSVWEAWQRIDQKTVAQLALFDRFEEGAKVYPITFFPPDNEGSKNERPIHHVIHYATISHHIFAPTFFAYRGQQPVLYKSRPRYIKVTQRKAPEAMEWGFIFANYDYIWGYQLDDAYRQFLTARCDVVAEQDGGVILRVRKAAQLQAGAPIN